MQSKLMLSLMASAAVLLFQPAVQTAWAQGQAALTVSVTSDAQGQCTFPESRLEPGNYTISIRAVGYDINSPAKAVVESEKTTTTEIKLKKTKNLASQLTNAEWTMS